MIESLPRFVFPHISLKVVTTNRWFMLPESYPFHSYPSNFEKTSIAVDIRQEVITKITLWTLLGSSIQDEYISSTYVEELPLRKGSATTFVERSLCAVVAAHLTFGCIAAGAALDRQLRRARVASGRTLFTTLYIFYVVVYFGFLNDIRSELI